MIRVENLLLKPKNTYSRMDHSAILCEGAKTHGSGYYWDAKIPFAGTVRLDPFVHSHGGRQFVQEAGSAIRAFSAKFTAYT